MAADPAKVRDVVKVEIIDKKDKNARADNDNKKREGREPKS